MNTMSNGNNAASDAAAAAAAPGSAAQDPASQAAAGQSTENGQAVNYEEAYKDLETKMGTMGNELGEYRQFFQNISPVLEKLDANPELVQAIVDGKIDKELVQAVAEGRVDVKDAQAVTQATEQVQKEVGKEKLEGMSQDAVMKLVEKKADEIRKELEEKADLSSFEEKTAKFIESTPDFADYAEPIDKWLDQHDVTDIEVAYWAVKGKLTAEQAQKAVDDANVEANRDMVANASGGGVTAQTAPDGTPLIDSLVGGPTNPLNNA